MGTVHSLKDRELWAKDWSKALKLYPSERALLLYLAYKAGKKGKVYGRSLDRLAEELSQSRRTLIRSIQTLKDEGLFTVHKQGQTPTEYIPDFESLPGPGVTPCHLPAPSQSGRRVTPSVTRRHPRGDTTATTAEYITGKNVKEPSPLPSPARDTEDLTYSAEGLKEGTSLRIHPNGDGTNGLDDIETITLEVRPAWREVAALRGKSVKWMVNQRRANVFKRHPPGQG